MNRLHLDWPELWEAAHRDEAQVVVAEPGHVIVAVPDRLLYGRGESSRRHLVSTGSLRAVVRLPATPTQGTDLHLVILEPPSNVSEVWFHDLRTGTGPRPDSVSKVTARLGSGVLPEARKEIAASGSPPPRSYSQGAASTSPGSRR